MAPAIAACYQEVGLGPTDMADTARSDVTGTQRAMGHVQRKPHGQELAGLSLAALGVVYGDIGTSPLYAMSECLSPTKPHAIAPGATGAYAAAQVLGVLSLFFWALVLVVVVKYLVFVLRADNKGEGGILALAALVQQQDKTPRRVRLSGPILLALFGAGLLYGDGVITPAVSVLGAIEGISEQNPALSELVVPISAAILIGLFWVQRFGTHRIGSVFGWVMLLWFFAIGVTGGRYILHRPEVLTAVSPHHAIQFLAGNGWHGFLLLGSVVLCITGAEALYADMGHFGRTPIRVAWSVVVFPGLLLNYFGQGALFLEDGAKVSNGFYDLVSDTPFLIPMVVLATMAAIIASQALISGAFSLTH